MNKYPNSYAALKAIDPVNSAAIVAAAIQAAAWQPEMIARFCNMIGADPAEVAGIVQQSRAGYGTAAGAWFYG